ncbi:MAG: type II secretion system GspH family protein [Elusimicrobiota bacterium]|jgi:hypothetical protein|nr:type II secretion system GspH family protein [Elusimicrobiota bacterium]
MKIAEMPSKIFNLLQKRGFSKIEIAAMFIIFTLCLIFSFFKFNSILDSAEEEAAKRNLISLRMTISSYYNDNNGAYPSADIERELINGKYLPKIPPLKIKHHSKTEKISIFKENQTEDDGTWVYVPQASQDGKKRAGDFYINCSHKNSDGNIWSSL